MAEQIPYIKVFISSPGDVNDERKIALEVIEQLPYQPVFRDKVAFRIVAWDKPGADTSMRATMTPQDAINRGLPKPSECDIVIVIFWSRLGTPFDDKERNSFESGTHWELLDAINSEHSRDRTVIYRRTEKVLFEETEIDRLEQKRRLTAFFESDLFYDSGRIKRGVNHYEKPENFRIQFNTHFQELVLEVLESAGKHPLEKASAEDYPDNENVTTIASVEWDSTKSPFPGLRSFTEEDAPIFFGRGHETDALVQHVAVNRFTAVVGASGSGKSSLVAAGLIPRLRVNTIEGSKDWKFMRITPGEQPLENLYEAMLETFPQFKPNPMEARRIKQNFISDMREAPETLLDICLSGLESTPEWTQLVLFVDQFEELFTLTDKSAQRVISKLLEAIASSERVRAIVTMRHDFYHRAIENQTLSELFRGTSFSLSIPKRDALREMIERPAERAQLTIEAALIDRILDDTGDEPGNLALMAYALDELYKLDDDKHLTHAEYDALGGVQGAIGIRAENQFKALNLDDSVIQQVFHALVEVDERGTATRRREQFKPDDVPENVRDLIYAFTDARLLTTSFDEQTKTATVEVAHEAILRQWERLANWIEATQDDHRTISRMKREARIWNERDEPEHLRPNAETLQEFQEACARLGVKIEESVLRKFAEPEQKRLYRELENISTSHERRRDIGDRLAVIGDTRPGVGLREDGLPHMLWVPVSGSDNKKIVFPASSRFGGGDAGSWGEFAVTDFYIAQYQVTYAQYQVFAESDYDNPEWWHDFPEDYQPQKLSGARTKIGNAPRDSVSWYQAVAYARWLDRKLREANLLPDASMQVRLPTEWEWQWAAMNGAELRKYPWGEWQEGYANTSEAGMNRTTAVGMYPHGKTQNGVLDMSGNLYEWCANNYSDPEIIDAANPENKVLRGGSFTDYMAFAACAYRYNFDPYAVFNYYGVRLVVSPLSRSAL